MDFNTFKSSLTASDPPKGISLALQALWMDAKGDRDAAHDLANQRDEGGGAWVHAYLHRKEGDRFNAGYWYRRAQKPFCSTSLQEEWNQIATTLLG